MKIISCGKSRWWASKWFVRCRQNLWAVLSTLATCKNMLKLKRTIQHSPTPPSHIFLSHPHNDKPRFGKLGLELGFWFWVGPLSLSEEVVRQELCWHREVCLIPSAAWNNNGGDGSSEVCQQSGFGYDALEIGSILHAALILNQGWVKKLVGEEKNVEKGVGPVRKWPATLSWEVGSPCPQDSPSSIFLDQSEEMVSTTWENPGPFALQEAPTICEIIPIRCWIIAGIRVGLHSIVWALEGPGR